MARRRRRSTTRTVTTFGVLALIALVGSTACGSAAQAVNTGTHDRHAWACPGPATAAGTGAESESPEAAGVPDLPTVTLDRSGTEVRVTDVSRILALDTHGTLAATVLALGLGDRLVGRDVSTGAPELADLPVVTQNGHDLNAEAILALRPTVVLTDYTIGPLEAQLQIREAGVPVVILDDQRTEDTIAPQIREVAAALGVPAAGARLASETGDRIAAAESRAAARREQRGGTAPRMVFLYLRGRSGTYDWFGRGTGADDLIDALGGTDVASEAGVRGYQPLDAEALAAADPEVMLVMTDGLASVGGIDGLVALPGVAETSAGRTRCVIDMADTEILAFGTRFASTVDALSAAVYRADGGA